MLFQEIIITHLHVLFPNICYDVKFIDVWSTETRAEERGQDLKGGSKKHLSQLHLLPSMLATCVCRDSPDSDLCCCLVYKDVWLKKAVKFFLMKVTILQVIINLYLASRMNKFVYTIMRQLQQIIKIYRSWQHAHFQVVFQKHIYFSTKGKKNLNDNIAKTKRSLGVFSA